MLNQNIRFDINKAVEGVFISSEAYKAHKQHVNMMADTRKYINRVMRDSHKEAEKIKKISYQKGFEQGLLDVVHGFIEFISEKNHLLVDLSRALELALGNIFKAYFEDDAVLLAILDKCIKAHSLLNHEAPLQVFLPNKKKMNLNFIKGIEHILADYEFDIVFHEADRYILKNEDQIVEFNEKEKTEQLKNTLQHHLFLNQHIEQFKTEVYKRFMQTLSIKTNKTREGNPSS